MRAAWAGVVLLLAGASAGPSNNRRVEKRSGLELALITGAWFHFGCEPFDHNCFDDEKPGRAAKVDSFWMGVTEVTVLAYERCRKAGACSGKTTVRGWEASCNAGRRDRPQHPVNCVTWSQANEFCAWIGGRLPTAEEWELAAKGREARLYPWGDAPPSGELLNWKARAVPGRTQSEPVGSHPKGASRDGLLDMAGNVWEWTATEHSTDTKEIRGGGWSVDDPRWFRSSNRSWWAASDRMLDLGFRCVLPAP